MKALHLFFSLLFIVSLGTVTFSTNAFVGGKDGRYAWINERDKRTGDSCCGENDCYTQIGNFSEKNRDTPRIENVESLPDGGYKFTFHGLGYTVQRHEVKPSEDGHFWACIPRPGFLRCFFAPPMGS